jgi:hypothetical protein
VNVEDDVVRAVGPIELDDRASLNALAEEESLSFRREGSVLLEEQPRGRTEHLLRGRRHRRCRRLGGSAGSHENEHDERIRHRPFRPIRLAGKTLPWGRVA